NEVRDRSVAPLDRWTALQDCCAHLLRLWNPGEYRLEKLTWQRVAAIRRDFPRTGEKPARPGVGRVHSLAGADERAEVARGQGRDDRCHRCGKRQGRDPRR